MSKTCSKCGLKTIFFYWSSTRGFPREKLINKFTQDSEKRAILSGRVGVPVCYKCAKEMGYPPDEKRKTEPGAWSVIVKK